MTPTTPRDWAADAKLCEAIPSGPYIAVQPRSQEGGMSLAHTGPSWAVGFPVRTSIRLSEGNPLEPLTWPEAERLAVFFAESRTGWPAALEEIARLQGLIDRWAEARAAYYPKPGSIALGFGEAYQAAWEALEAAAAPEPPEGGKPR